MKTTIVKKYRGENTAISPSLYKLFFATMLALCPAVDSAQGESAPLQDASPTTNEITEIHITGSLSPTALDRVGKPVSIITHEELQERTEPTVGELLSSEPGVSGTYFGPGASRPVIRGQAKQRVRVLENGLENGDLSDVSDDHAVTVDPLAVQRIDVLRGPSTLLFGSGAIAGVVNMIDQSIAEVSVGRTASGEIDLRKGNSADDESTGAVTVNGEIGSFNWHLSGFHRETDDIEIPGFAESSRFREREEESEDEHEHAEEEEVRGTLNNSDTLAQGIKVGGSHIWSQGFVGVALKFFDAHYGIPGGHHHHEDESEHEEHSEEVQNLEDALPEVDMNQFRLESRGELRLADDFFKAVRFGAAYSSYEHQELEGNVVATDFNKESFEGRVELTHGHDDGFQGGWGSQFRYDDIKAEGEEAFIPPSRTFAPALFAVEDYLIREDLVWQLGGRYEFANVEANDIASRDFNLISASTGPVVNLDKHGIYTSGLSFSYSERAPTSTELFANGAHLATQSFEIGDKNLDKEQSVGAELVLRKNSGRLTAGTSLFWQQYLDYINLTPTGEEREGLPEYLYQMERARFWGFEAEADYQLFCDNPDGFHLYGQIDFVRGESLSDNDSLPRITPARTKVGLKYKIEKLSTYVENTFVSKQDHTADFELPTDGYSMLNAGAAYQLPLDAQQSYELYARATNLLDEEARVHTSFLKDVAPLRGRAFFVGLRLAF